jgi:hypothetical protein
MYEINPGFVNKIQRVLIDAVAFAVNDAGDPGVNQDFGTVDAGEMGHITVAIPG